MTLDETKNKMDETLSKAETIFVAKENNQDNGLSARHINRFVNIHLNKDLFLNLSDDTIVESKLNGVSNMNHYIKQLGLYTTARSRLSASKQSTPKKKKSGKSHGHVSKKLTHGYVYFLKMGSENAVKIGHAGNLWKRINSLKHYDFDLDKSFYVKCRAGKAHLVEKYLHFKYADYEITREDQMDGADEFFDDLVIDMFKENELATIHMELKHAIVGVYNLTDDERM